MKEMRPDTLSKLAVSVAICAAAASSVAVGLANSRIDDLEIQRDIYKSRAEDWEETAGVIAQYADDLADELKIRGTLDKKLVVEYAGVFECTAYCTEKYQHICGTGTGITASGQPIQADVTVRQTDASPLWHGGLHRRCWNPHCAGQGCRGAGQPPGYCRFWQP